MKTVWHVTVISGGVNDIGAKIARYMNEGWYCSGDLILNGSGIICYQKMTKRERVY